MSSHRNIFFKASAAAIAAGVVLALTTGTASASSFTQEGCPSGAVCIYPQNAGWNGGHPEANGIFYSYGPHNLSGQQGIHDVYNNQTGGATATLNWGYNGANAHDVVKDDTVFTNANLTPVNSITLIR